MPCLAGFLAPDVGSPPDVGFADLNLAPALVTTVADIGWTRPSALQASAIPAIRRGANVVLYGSRGSGITAAWALSLLDRVISLDVQAAPTEHSPLALVATATADRAVAVASCLSALAADSVPVRALAAGWQAQGAHVLVGSANSIANAIERAAIKLATIRVIVVDGFSAISTVADDALLNTIFVSVPTDAQRVVTTAARDARLQRFLEAHARKALTFPTPSPPAAGPVAEEDLREVHCLETTEPEKAGALARLVARRQDNPRVAARTPARAASLEADLTRRGLAARCVSYGRGPVEIGYDPPMSASDAELLEAGATVLVRPGEEAHLRQLAGTVGLNLKMASEREPGGALARYRQELARAARTADLEAQLLVLEPLFQEFSASELAAALSALLRDKRAAETAVSSAATASARSEAPAAARKPPSFVRLYVGAGQRDNLRPADIVGAFTAEASIRGDQIGRIDVRDTFSVVEVDAEVAERVIHSLNGTTMRGRALRVDYDRRPGPPTRGAHRPKRRPSNA